MNQKEGRITSAWGGGEGQEKLLTGDDIWSGSDEKVIPSRETCVNNTLGVFEELELRDERPPIDSGFPGNVLNKGHLAVERLFPTVIH